MIERNISVEELRNEKLLNDKDVASLVNFSVAWVRKERWLRRSGKPHSLNIDPVIIGNTPRYRSSEIKEWLKNLNTKNEGK
tara:strand:+ start:25869 stop:26111 length:243 start_codon:yes stop_codon:yes gene_type:complete